MKRAYRFHPAALQLNALGVTAATIARDVGVSPAAVSQQLAGTNRLRDDVRDAIVERVGASAAADVLDAIPQATERAAA